MPDGTPFSRILGFASQIAETHSFKLKEESRPESVDQILTTEEEVLAFELLGTNGGQLPLGDAIRSFRSLNPSYGLATASRTFKSLIRSGLVEDRPRYDDPFKLAPDVARIAFPSLYPTETKDIVEEVSLFTRVNPPTGFDPETFKPVGSKWLDAEEEFKEMILGEESQRLPLAFLEAEIAEHHFRRPVVIPGTGWAIRPFWRDGKPTPELPFSGRPRRDHNHSDNH